MKLLKKISLCIILSLSIFTFYGCKSNSPSKVVKDHLEEIKNANDKDISMLVKLMGVSNENGEEELVKEMINQIKKIDYKIDSEEINGDRAVVHVDITGPDFEVIINNVMKDISTTIVAQAFSGVEMTEEEIDKTIENIMLKAIKNSDFTTRKGEVNLVKENKKWKLSDENEMYILIFNFDPYDFDPYDFDLYDSMELIDDKGLIGYENSNKSVEEMILNQPFSVKTKEGEYSITIEGLRLTDERNQFSNIEAKQVVFLDYTYSNISCNSDLYISDFDFQVLDEEGNVLDVYPIYDRNRTSKDVPVGGKCKASVAFAVPTDSKKLNVTYTRYSEKLGRITLDIK